MPIAQPLAGRNIDMARDQNYPARYSRVTVTLNDGEVREYDIAAGCGLLPYLMRESKDTGAFVLLCGDETYAIPTSAIREVAMKEFATAEEREAFYAKDKT